MGHTIKVLVADKIATADKTLYVCDNSDYVIEFTFDEEWAQFDTKTARFTWNGTYEDKIFTGNRCPVPRISNTQKIYVGVFAGDIRTTTPAFVPALQSILSVHGTPAAPTPDVYSQIIEKLEAVVAAARECVKTVNGTAPDENGNVNIFTEQARVYMKEVMVDIMIEMGVLTSDSVASDTEAEDMISDEFSTGSDTDTDGGTSPGEGEDEGGGSIADEDLATDDEVNDVIENIFGD